jgi:hypothetical protein
LAKLLRAARVRSAKLTEALQKAEATSRELEDMPFRSRLELVTCLEGSAVAPQIERPPEEPEEMSDEIGVTMRALMRLLQPG